LRDPVCGTVLDEKTAKFRINFEGETYYFCSASCKKKFKRHPKKFVKQFTFHRNLLIKSARAHLKNTVAAVNLNQARHLQKRIKNEGKNSSQTLKKDGG